MCLLTSYLFRIIIINFILINLINTKTIQIGRHSGYGAGDPYHPEFIDDYKGTAGLRHKYLHEHDASFWRNNAQHFLENKLKQTHNTKVAKNIILFLGDGMSIPTLAATRVYLGGEEQRLFFEQFPYTGLAKVILFFFWLFKKVINYAINSFTFIY